MSDSDSFINEVTEEVRRDRMFALWKKYGPLVLAAVVLIVVGGFANSWWNTRQQLAAEEAGGALIAIEREADAAARAGAYEAAAAAAEGGPALAALLRAAAAHEAAGETGAAKAAFEAVALDPAASSALSDFARFRALTLGAEDMPPADFATALAPLAEVGGPYRLLALEARAGARASSGDMSGAIEDLNAILDSPDATQGTRARASEWLAALGAGPGDA